jgi:hypothetical protein
MSTGELFRTQGDTSVIVAELFFFADFRKEVFDSVQVYLSPVVGFKIMITDDDMKSV